MELNPMSTLPSGRLPSIAQSVAAPLTRAAIFLAATIKPGSENRTTLRSFCGDLAALVRAVEFRDLEGGLSCVVGFGSDAWGRLFGPPRPAELHPFREIRAGARHAVSTPGAVAQRDGPTRPNQTLRHRRVLLPGRETQPRAPARRGLHRTSVGWCDSQSPA